MQPSSLRVGPTSARNSASSSGSCPSRGFRSTTRVTASFGSLPFLVDLRDALFFAPVARFRRPPEEDLVTRFAIGAGLYPNPPKTPPGPRRSQQCRHATGVLEVAAPVAATSPLASAQR